MYLYILDKIIDVIMLNKGYPNVDFLDIKNQGNVWIAMIKFLNVHYSFLDSLKLG